MPKITIIATGQSHFNPAPFNLIRKQLAKLHALKVKVLILEEVAGDSTLAKLVKRRQEQLHTAEDAIASVDFFMRTMLGKSMTMRFSSLLVE